MLQTMQQPHGVERRNARLSVATPSTSSDAELIRASQAGEAWAWDALIERYSRLIYSVPMKYGLQSAEADDVFQEVCIVWFKRLRTLRSDKSLSSWLIAVAVRKSLDALRKHRSRRSQMEPASAEETEAAPEDEMPDDAPLPEEEVEQLQAQHMVRQALARLPERSRQFIWHLYLDPSQPSYAEVADRLNMPLGSIGPSRGRALEKLKQDLIQQGMDW